MAAPTRRFGTHDLEMLLVTVIWGGNFSLSKFAMLQLPALPMSALRFTVASALLLLIARHMGVMARLPRKTLLALIGLGVIGNTLYQALFMTGLSLTSATNSAMLVAALPVIVALLGTALRIELATPRMWLGVGLGTAGVILVVSAGGVRFSSESFRGDLLVLGAVCCWSFYTVGVRRIGSGVDPLQITAITTTAGVPGLLLIGMPGLLREDWGAIAPKTWAALIYSGLLALVLSYVLYNRAVQAIGSGRTALYNCLTPLVAMVVAWFTLGESPTPLQFVGVALVIGGVLVSVTRSSVSLAESAPPSAASIP
jgi:drug/metabolite transporter (DMT)-like permease